MKQVLTWVAAFFATFTLLAAPAKAQSIFNQKTDYATVALHTGVMGENGVRTAALRMELKPGWKTYWRIPGDSGLPPIFDWTGSENLKDVQTVWTRPHVFTQPGDRTFGYKSRMVVPLNLTPVDPTKPIKLRLNFSYGVCADICIPAGEDFALDIPPDAPEDGAYFIDRAMADQLVAASPGAVRQAICQITTENGETRLYVGFQLSDPFQAAPVVIAEHLSETGAEIIGRFEAQLANGGVVAMTRLHDNWIDRSAMRFTVLGENRGMVIMGCTGA